eukprot:1144977-Pelagomonas_calceolata.AAC.4
MICTAIPTAALTTHALLVTSTIKANAVVTCSLCNIRHQSRCFQKYAHLMISTIKANAVLACSLCDLHHQSHFLGDMLAHLVISTVRAIAVNGAIDMLTS